jgi:hypothetical protein
MWGIRWTSTAGHESGKREEWNRPDPAEVVTTQADEVGVPYLYRLVAAIGADQPSGPICCIYEPDPSLAYLRPGTSARGVFEIPGLRTQARVAGVGGCGVDDLPTQLTAQVPARDLRSEVIGDTAIAASPMTRFESAQIGVRAGAFAKALRIAV